jgi:ribosomal protein S18 acetylase RimI-like enzyme
VILREATADDGSALESFDLGDTSSPWLAEVAEIVSGLLAWQGDTEPVDLDRRVVVAELDDEIVAVAAHLQLTDMQGKAYPKHRYLMVVAVRADQRRRGVALFLVESVLADLRRRDVRTVRWLVHPRNAQSIAFSRSVFSEADETQPPEDKPYVSFVLGL